MKTSIEITLMPLSNDYQEIIKEFIVSLRNEDFKIIENPLSTQIYGDFDKMMNSLIFRIKKYFSIHEGIIINLKIVNGDRSNYKPNF